MSGEEGPSGVCSDHSKVMGAAAGTGRGNCHTGDCRCPPTFPGSLEGALIEGSCPWPQRHTHSPGDHKTAQVSFTCGGLGDILRHLPAGPSRGRRSLWLSAQPAPGAVMEQPHPGHRCPGGLGDQGLPCTFLLADGWEPHRADGPLPAHFPPPPAVITGRSWSLAHGLCRPSRPRRLGQTGKARGPCRGRAGLERDATPRPPPGAPYTWGAPFTCLLLSTTQSTADTAERGLGEEAGGPGGGRGQQVWGLGNVSRWT